ncbi:PREDICTED: protein dispatched-like [Vollenhovia emeryi]|uniref:protein dispatched-like n=1 Tax=Vollenhovia emeryi TaxID=411798 RepID=UPI0005F4F9F6|nr:PREDICTED: protein dispatched-like [Vollenhovia emeryi]
MEAPLFPRAIAHYPYVIVLVIFIFSSICLIIPLTTEEFPDFSDPQMGFEARGTVLSQRLTAWSHLVETTKPRGELTDNPFEYRQYLHDLAQQGDSGPRRQTSRNRSRRKD